MSKLEKRVRECVLEHVVGQVQCSEARHFPSYTFRKRAFNTIAAHGKYLET